MFEVLCFIFYSPELRTYIFSSFLATPTTSLPVKMSVHQQQERELDVGVILFRLYNQQVLLRSKV